MRDHSHSAPAAGGPAGGPVDGPAGGPVDGPAGGPVDAPTGWRRDDTWRRMDTFRTDLHASLVVFLVAIPLSLGVAVAAGAPVAAGLIAAAIGGIVVGALGGAPAQVSGPAVGLTVIIAGLISTYGWRVTCAVTAAAGVVQILLGISRVARAVLAVSPAIVHGMLGGIGLTIVVDQAQVMLGGQPGNSPLSAVAALPGQLVNNHDAATGIGAATILIILVWPRIVRRLPGPLWVLPAPLVAVVFVASLAFAADLDLPRVDLPEVIGNAVSWPRLPSGAQAGFADCARLALAVVGVALVASAESLLSAVAVGKMANAARCGLQHIDLDRELRGQGVANVVAGLVGGLPVAGVIVRGSVNVAAGARTRASAVLHGLWVLLFTVFFAGAVEWIPLSALAGLLVIVGIRLIDVSHLADVRRHGELPVYAVTFVGVVAINLLAGVTLGMLTALVLLLRRALWPNIQLVHTGGMWRVDVEGTLSFACLPRLARVLGRIPARAPVLIELVVDYLDHASFDHLRAWCAQHQRAGGSVTIDEVGHAWFRRLPDGDPASVSRGFSSRRVIPHLPRWFAPWSQWQALTDGAQDQPHPVGTMLVGVTEFHRRAAPLLRDTLGGLAAGQNPTALFIACADSRVVPNIITTSGPGDLFTVRNVGNLVPPVTGDKVDETGKKAPSQERDLSVAAALEYAIDVLKVPTIVVCGHSGCGAMQAVLSGTLDQPSETGKRDSDPTLARWLMYARGALELMPVVGTESLPPLEQLGRANVVAQLEHLRSHPAVRRALEQGTVELVGLYFDISAAHTWVLDPRTGRFVDPTEALTAVRMLPRGVSHRCETQAGAQVRRLA